MSRAFCIHGHFYQPPRQDPWLEDVLPEGSAAPASDWNARICEECYTPLAYAKRMNGDRIASLVNCYEWISFNFGPTLLSWMEGNAPDTYKRIIQGDRLSYKRLGHGNALAQVYHHVIMPLSTDLDRDLEIVWAIQDFEARFGRRPEGMWLAEAAVDIPTLESLAARDIKFTVLAPRQAQAIADLGGDNWQEVNQGNLDTTQAYLVHLPSGKEISIFFYDGPISQAVAFERLLADGDQFWHRLTWGHEKGLRHIATDGESYGHHFKFGEMALAYLIEQAMHGRDGCYLTNYGAWLAENPPQKQVRIWENSSWSCAHGVERWRSDCGCRDGGHPEWNQKWRRPLRRALNHLRYFVSQHYNQQAKQFILEPKQALLEFGAVLAKDCSLREFCARHFKPGLSKEDVLTAQRLLVMQRWSLASFASCAWFFDDIARLEPLNALTYALRSIQLLRQTGGPETEPEFLEILDEAFSNDESKGTGRDIWEQIVCPRQMHDETLLMLGTSLAPPIKGRVTKPDISWPGVRMKLEYSPRSEGGFKVFVRICPRLEDCKELNFIYLPQDACAPDAGNPDPGLIMEGESGPLCRQALSLRHRLLISRAISSNREDMAWNSLLLQAQKSWNLFLPFDEGQHVPQGAFKLMAPALAWVWIREGREAPDEMRQYLTQILRQNPAARELVEQRVPVLILNMIARNRVPWKKLKEVLTRTLALGLIPNWAQVQNRIWSKGLENADKDALKLLGFAGE